VLECLFACWAAGLCAVPVNAKLHVREVAYILSDCGARFIVTTPGLVSDTIVLNDISPCTIICAGTDEYRRLLAATPIEPVPAAPGDLAWLFYTRGTTRRPKGVMLSHRNLLAARPGTSAALTDAAS